jgi:hypothetical protein
VNDTIQIGNRNTNGAAIDQQSDQGERQPLLPRIESRRTSGSSDGTLRESQEKEDDEEKEKSYLKSPIWWLGITLMIIGEAGNFLAYGFAPASIVSPLGVVALISNCLIAPLLLGENFRWRDGLGVLIAIAGCVVVVLSASESNPKLSPDAIWYLVSRWEFETYVGLTLFLILILVSLSNKYGDRTLLVDLGLVALFGAYTALSTKGVASLLALDIWRVVTYPITYLLLTVLVFTAVMQIKYVNRALQHFNATMVIPTQFVLFTISVILGSAVLYRDFETKKTEDAVKFIAGCALTFSGVWCITSGRGNESDSDDEEDDEEESLDYVSEQTGYSKYLIDDGAMMGDESPKPGLQRSHTSGDLPITIPTIRSSFTDGGEAESSKHNLTNPFVDVAPANATAVHMDSRARLPTPSDNNDPTKKPPFHATTSAPIVPTTPTRPTNTNPPTIRRQTLTRTPSTPNRPSTGPNTFNEPRNANLLDPAPSPQRLLTRHSVAGLLPGPLTSPLSASLAAIVADELRRSTIQTLRRKRSQAVAAAAAGPPLFHTPKAKRHSVGSGGEADFEREVFRASEEVQREQEGSGRKTGRMRSLSATLGDIFGSSGRGKKGGASTAAAVQGRGDDAAAGPSQGEEQR